MQRSAIAKDNTLRAIVRDSEARLRTVRAKLEDDASPQAIFHALQEARDAIAAAMHTIR